MDTQVRYRDRVADSSEVDREAWAVMVATWVAARFGNNQTKFAAFAEVSARTVGRWIGQELGVDSDTVRDIARKLGLNPTHVLAELGYFRQDEVTGERQPLDPDVRAILAKLADPTTSTRERQLIRQVLRSLADSPSAAPPANGGPKTAAG